MICKKCNYRIVETVKVEYRITGFIDGRVDDILDCRDDGNNENWEQELIEDDWLDDSLSDMKKSLQYRILCPNCGEDLGVKTVGEFVEQLAKDGTITKVIDEDGNDNDIYELDPATIPERGIPKIEKVEEPTSVPVSLPIRPQDFEF
jgi:hypothetical protein